VQLRDRSVETQSIRVFAKAASRVYELTDWGMALKPVIIGLGRWGARSPSRPRDAALGVDSLILSFRTMFNPCAAEGFGASYELRLDEHRFCAVAADGRFEVARGSAEEPDATIETDASTLAALVYDGRELAEAVRSGNVKIEGDESADPFSVALGNRQRSRAISRSRRDAAALRSRRCVARPPASRRTRSRADLQQQSRVR